MSLAIPDMFSHAVDTGDVVTTLVASLSLVVSIFALLAGQHREKRQENQRRRERDQDVSTKALTYLATFASNTSSPVSEEFRKGDFQDQYRARHRDYSAASMELEQLKRRLGRNDVKTLVDEAVELMATQMMTVRGIAQTMEAMSQAQRDNPGSVLARRRSSIGLLRATRPVLRADGPPRSVASSYRPHCRARRAVAITARVGRRRMPRHLVSWPMTSLLTGWRALQGDCG
jgi:hypothetical protein